MSDLCLANLLEPPPRAAAARAVRRRRKPVRIRAIALVVICAAGLAGGCAINFPPTADDLFPKGADGQEDDTEAAEDEGEGEEKDGDANDDNLLDWMRDGVPFTRETVTVLAESEGKATCTEVLAVERSRWAMSMECVGSDSGETALKRRIITKDGKRYDLDEVKGTGFVEPAEDEDYTLRFAEMELLDSGVGEIDGRELPFEEYLFANYDTHPLTFFFEDGQVYGFTEDVGGAEETRIVTDARKGVDEAIFAIPADLERYMEDAEERLGRDGSAEPEST